MNPLITVITPTTGASSLYDAIESVRKQTQENISHLIVIDGKKAFDNATKIIEQFPATDNKLKVCFLPDNVGSNGFYGHRVYAAFTHLVNTKYVMYLDQDCSFAENHIETCIKTIEKNNLDWCYSLRMIMDKEGSFLCNDDCESLGRWPVFTEQYNHIDTNCYCIKTDVAIRIAQVWHGKWGQDRVFFSNLSNYFNNFDTTGKYTVKYKLEGNEGSVKPEFFYYGNGIMRTKYNDNFPWCKE